MGGVDRLTTVGDAVSTAVGLPVAADATGFGGAAVALDAAPDVDTGVVEAVTEVAGVFPDVPVVGEATVATVATNGQRCP